MQNSFYYSVYQFALFRIIFGSFLFFYYWQFLVLASDKTWLIGLLVLSLCIVCGFFRQYVAWLLLFSWFFECYSEKLTSHMVFVLAWLLLVMAITPSGEPLSIFRKKRDTAWALPPFLFRVAWALIATLYVIDVFSFFVLRDSQKFANVEPLVWLETIVSLLFVFCCFFKKTRALAWFLVMALYLAGFIINGFDITNLSLVVFLLFMFDSRWFLPERTWQTNPVVFFDGVCGLCNRAVDFLIQNDFAGTFRYAPLQGEHAQKYLPAEDIEQLKTIILLHDGKTYTKSNAALMICKFLGGIWFFAQVFWLIPQRWRDFLYDLISKNRYKIFGKHETCRLPSAKERDLFL